jgi:DNA-binding beta-propeller fold protein YncE
MKPMSLKLIVASFALIASSVLPAYAQDTAHRTVDVIADDSGRLLPAPRPRGIVVDPAQHYWADPAGNRIVRSDPGGMLDEVIAAGLNVPYGLGFDSATQSFVWTSSGDEVVQKLVLADHRVSNLTTSFDDPPAIEIAQEGGKQAITVVDSDVVRVSVDEISDETRTEVLLSLGSAEIVHGLALDAEAGHLYVGNAVGMMAYKIDLADNTISRLTFTDHVAPIPDADAGELP